MRETHFIDKDPDIYNALTELQKRNVQSMNEDQVMKFIEEFEFKWYLVDTDGYSSCMHRATRLGYNQFIHPDNFDESCVLKPDNVDIMAIRGIKNRMINFLIELNNHVQINIKTNANEDEVSIKKRINNIILQIEDGFENVRRHLISFERVVSPTAMPQISVYTDPSTMDDEEVEKSTALQKCIMLSLKEAKASGYRRYKGQCCEEVKTVD